MGRIANNKIDGIRESFSIVDIISEYIPLKKVGSNYKALCPFHQEKTPSFIVNPLKEIFHCFGCGVGGNIFTFIMKMENIEFVDALKILAKKAGVDIIDEVNSKTVKEKDGFYKIQEFAARFYNKNLLENANGSKAMEYLEKRGIKDETIKEFKLGFALNSWDSLISSALKNEITMDSLLKTGLIVQKQKDDLQKDKQTGCYDRFRNRIIFPISDSRNRIIGFGARALDDSLPKYINSPDTIIYHKGDNLYGWNLAKDEAAKIGHAVLVEGYFDCIMCHQEGIKNVCAVLGTGLTYNQAELLKRYVDKCIILFDVDIAGVEASMRGINVLVENGIFTRIASVPSGKDPDEFLRTNTKEELIDIISNSKDLIEYKLSKSSIKSIDEKVKIVKEILPLLSKIKNMVERGAYIAELADKLRIGEKLIWLELNKITKQEEKVIKSGSDGELSNNLQSSRIQDKAGRDLLKIMLTSGTEISEKIFNEITPDEFENSTYKEIAKNIYNLLKKSKKIDVSNIISDLKDQNMIEIVTKLAIGDSGYLQKDIMESSFELIKVIKKVKDESKFEELRKEYISGNISKEKREEFIVLLKKLKGFNNKKAEVLV